MTPKQDALYWREWGALSRRCKMENWTLPDRYDLHRKALAGCGCGKCAQRLADPEKISHTTMDNHRVDLVLGVFRSYSQVENVNAQVRQQRQPRNRLETKIKIEQMKLLAVVLGTTPEDFQDGRIVMAADVVPDFEAAFAYCGECAAIFGSTDLAQISDEVRPRFLKVRGKVVERDGQPVVTSEKSDLELLRDTLDARINELRNGRGGADSGWSIHDLKVAAGVPCWCATFCRGKAEVAATANEEGRRLLT